MKLNFKKHKIVKEICLVLLVILLLIPMLKEYAPFVKEGFNVEKVDGYFKPIDRPELSLENWWSGTFQNSRDEILKRDLGIQAFAFRVNNQLHQSILKEIRTNYVEGKDGYYFGKDYIEDYLGLDYVGDQNVKTQMEKLQYVSARLKEDYDVEMIVAIAPSKAYVLEDKLPPQYDISQKKKGNYEGFLEGFKKYNIKVLDFNKYLTEQVEETQEKDPVLMPKYGIHWSEYAATLAADSLTQYIGLLKGKKVARVYKKKIVKSKKSRNQDEDISESMNLLYPLPSQEYSYFEDFDKDTIGKYKPNIALIGDSFSWTFWAKKIPQKLWGEESLLMYYYYTLWTAKTGSSSKTQKEMLIPYAKKMDAFVILYTPMTMKTEGFCNGFIDRFYRMLKAEEEKL